MNYLQTLNEDGILIVTLDQPHEKVNKLSEQLIDEFTGLLERAAEDTVTGMILISGKKNNFIAGADVAMLKEKQAPQEVEDLSRRGNELLLRVENYPKPIVAAIHGACVGGGNEVAMACHYRVATDHSSTHFSQPEVKLGLLPGGGGTQRLPKLIGLQKALTYLLTGKKIYPKKAYKLGLVDELIHKDALLTAAKEGVRTLSEGDFNRKDKRSLMEKIVEATKPGRSFIFSKARERSQKETNGNYPAPPLIIDCVEEGYKNGIKAGTEKEMVSFGKLAATRESKELVNLFFVTEHAKKNPSTEKVRKVDKIGILGAGLMGTGIADVSINGGYRVVLKDQSMEQAFKGKQHIWRNLDKKADKKIISSFERDKILSRLTPADSYQNFNKIDLIIEAVFEDLNLKHTILKEVEQKVPDHCIFATNTSSLPIHKIAETAQRPEQVVGMHYFSPVQKMPLVEIIQTRQTADWVTATARQVALEQGKHVIVVNDGPGFYTTRILALYMNEALLLLEEGISIEQLDRAMEQFGFPVGPAALLDEVGIDIAAHITGTLNPIFAERGIDPGNKPKELLDDDFKGKKNRNGFYTYESSGSKKKKKEPNKAIYKYFGGEERKEFDTEEVQQRMALMMINEAARCLEENILQQPGDGDIGAVMGLGFPPFLGGPFRYIDSIGAAEITNRLLRRESDYGLRFKPAGILKDFAETGERFHKVHS